jgi:hypothetical protein
VIGRELTQYTLFEVVETLYVHVSFLCLKICRHAGPASFALAWCAV